MDEKTRAMEARRLAPFPHFPESPEGLAEFISAIDLAISDRMLFRARAIGLHNYLGVRFLGHIHGEKYLLGKDGWLFLGGQNAVRSFRNTHPFTWDELEAWRESLEAKHKVKPTKHLYDI